MIRFTKNLFSSTPSTVIEVEEINYNVDEHNSTDNMFVSEARLCKLECFIDDDIETIATSSHIYVNKNRQYSDADWQTTNYSVYQAELLDNNGNPLFTGFVDLTQLELDYKNHIAKVILVDTLGIVAELYDTEIGQRMGADSWYPWWQNKTPVEIINQIFNIAWGSSEISEHCMSADPYEIRYNLNYEINSDIPEGLMILQDLDRYWIFDSWISEERSQFIYNLGDGWDFSSHHYGCGFMYDNGQLYLLKYLHLQAYYDTESRDQDRYSIEELFVLRKQHINIHFNSEDDWYEAIYHQDEELFRIYESSSHGVDHSHEPLWNTIQTNSDMEEYWIAINATEDNGITFIHENYPLFFYTAGWVQNNISVVTGSLLGNFTFIPFAATYDLEMHDYHTIKDLLKMSILMGVMTLTCDNMGKLHFNQVNSTNTEHNINASDVFELKIKNIKMKTDYSDIIDPFLTLGWEEDSDEIKNIINPIKSFWESITSTTNRQVEMEILNNYNIAINDVLNYDGNSYRIYSFKLDLDNFAYKIKAWSI